MKTNWPAPCEFCGAQVAGYMDIDFQCQKRRCPLRSLLKAKDEMAQVAYQGSEPEASKREALRIMLDVLLWSAQHLDDN